VPRSRYCTSTPAELPEAAHGAYLGLLGRGQPSRDPGPRVAELAAASASDLLDAAARRLGRPCDRIQRHGHPEREVVTAAAHADLLIMARDGDQARLGPRSLGKRPGSSSIKPRARSCWYGPKPPPSITTIPPPPPGKKDHGPHHP
jgi:hypothetical protein